MAFADRVISVKLLGDVSQLNKSLDKTEGRLKKLTKGAGSWLKSIGIGLAITGVEKLVDSIGDAYAGFKSGERLAAQLGVTFDNLGLSSEQLTEALDFVSASTRAIGTSDDEAIQVMNDSIKRTGDLEESKRRLAIAQDVAASKNISLTAAMKLVDKAADGNKKALRELGIEGDTAGERVDNMGKKFKGAAKKKADLDPLGVFFNSLGEDLEGIVGNLASGNIEGALEALGGIGDTLKTLWDNIAPKVTATLDAMTGGKFSDIVAAIQPLVDVIGVGLQGALDGIATAFQNVNIGEAFGQAIDRLSDLATNIAPSLQTALATTGEFIGTLISKFSDLLVFLDPVLDILIGVAGTGIKSAFDLIAGIMETIIALLNGDFGGAWQAIQDTISTVIGNVLGLIDDILPALQGIVGGVIDTAADIGQGIVDGIVKFIQDLPRTIVKIAVDMVNGFIDMWNKLDFRIPAFEIPIPSFRFGEGTILDTGNIGGGSFKLWDASGDLVPNLDRIRMPRLEEGGIVKARPGGILANIGEGRFDEAVVPLDGKNMGGDTIHITVNGFVGNEVQLAQQLSRILQQGRKHGVSVAGTF